MPKTKNKALELFAETSSNQNTSLFDENQTAPKRMGRPPKSENKKYYEFSPVHVYRYYSYFAEPEPVK